MIDSNAKAKTLKEFFEKTGIKQGFMARKLGIDQSYMSQIVNGKRRPSPDLAKKISDHTGVPLEALLFPDEETEDCEKAEV